MLSPLARAELYLYGEIQGNVSVCRFPPNGEDRPDDMAQAWLEGRMERYEELAAEHRRKMVPPPALPASTRKSRSKGIRSWNRAKAIYDAKQIRALRAQGLSLRKISILTGCCRPHISRICRGQTRLSY